MICDIIEQLKSELKNGVKLMAVSKTRTLDEVRAAFECGQTLFGENHVQELVAKFDPQTNPLASSLRCEMIGHLQRNKVRQAVRLASRIDSVDSLQLALKIDNEAALQGKVMPVLIEVNTSGEDSKSGFLDLAKAEDAIGRISLLNNIEIEGFLTVGPVLCTVGTAQWEKKTHESFAMLREFQNRMLKSFPESKMNELSMGMTHDWRIAVEEGSTMVRIGTLIFGERAYAESEGCRK
ncbi:MAG: YggS family pyridoxal phosphate-dependent enzyme [Spirochaetales bacterium]|nr:YggS family pyridoxal phosphate-dependent enzyme [Spirochaetales bacterium]